MIKEWMQKKWVKIGGLAAIAIVVITIAAVLISGISDVPTPPDYSADSSQQDTSNDEQSSTGDQQDTTGDQQDTTGDPLDSTGDQQDTSGDQQDPSGDQQPETVIKNIIFMVADGGGYDNYTLADKVKKEMLNRGVTKLAGAKTDISSDLLSGLGKSSVTGLYLNEFLAGSANTLLLTPNGDENNYKSYITDSAAAGTALSSGYKTTYSYVGIDSAGKPRASLSELARMNGMATGIVTTKSFVDATPATFFSSHALHRYEYQDNSLQALISGIDVVIGEGTIYGDMFVKDKTSHRDISAATMGFTVARSRSELLACAGNSATTKLWATILGVDTGTKALKNEERDTTSDHISYDVDAATSSEQPSILDMTKAALQVLGSNINDPDGFFLMIEGGALDNAAETGCIRPAVGEYLAFDEAFGYCVNWAATRGDTIVIAVPDHDSGGFSGIEACEAALIDSIITGNIGSTPFHSTLTFDKIKTALAGIGADTSAMTIHSGHTDMAVPISLYAPDGVKSELLSNMGLPTASGNVRTGSNGYYVKNESGTFTRYASSALNNDYIIENSAIAPAIAKTLKLGSLDDATDMLYVNIGHTDGSAFTGQYGGSITFDNIIHTNTHAKYCYNSYQSQDGRLSVGRNTTVHTLDGVTLENEKIGDLSPRAIFVLGERREPKGGTFYAPYNVLVSSKLAWSITIEDETSGIGKVLLGKGTDGIVLPAAADGAALVYTDGTKEYRSGDTVQYPGSNLTLKIK